MSMGGGGATSTPNPAKSSHNSSSSSLNTPDPKRGRSASQTLDSTDDLDYSGRAKFDQVKFTSNENPDWDLSRLIIRQNRYSKICSRFVDVRARSERTRPVVPGWARLLRSFLQSHRQRRTRARPFGQSLLMFCSFEYSWCFINFIDQGWMKTAWKIHWANFTRIQKKIK